MKNGVLEVASSVEVEVSPPAARGCCGRRTRLEKCLIPTVVLLVLLAAGIVALWAIKDLSYQVKRVCFTPDCVHAAHRLISRMDPDVDPCEDFYRHACGSWQRKQRLQSDQLYYALNTNELEMDTYSLLSDLLEQPPSLNELAAFTKLKIFYRSCLRTGKITEQGVLPVGALISELGGFQTESSWSKQPIDLTSLLVQILQVNGAPLVDVVLHIDHRNKSRFSVVVTLPRRYGLSSPLRRSRSDLARKLQRVINQRAALTGDLKQNNSLTREQVYEVLKERMSKEQKTELESLLSKLGWFEEIKDKKEKARLFTFVSLVGQIYPSERDQKVRELKSSIYELYTVSRLQREFSYLDWQRLISSLLKQEVTSEQEVYVHFPDYLRRLAHVVGGLPQRIVHNGVLALYVRDVLKELVEVEDEEDRWQFCVEATTNMFGEALAGLYLRNQTQRRVKDLRMDVAKLFEIIHGTFLSDLPATDWMDEQTMKAATKKIREIRANIAAPDFYFNNDFLDKSMQNVALNKSDFFGNVITLYRTFRREMYDLYMTDVDQELITWSFIAYPFTPNAFYQQSFNSIVVPMALLRDPFYSAEIPAALQFGAMGTTIAHEVLHALDGRGLMFDSHGARRRWWSPEVELKFEHKSACVRESYSRAFSRAIQLKGQQVLIKFDGKLTVNEDAADLGGMKYALAAYSHQGNDAELPGLKKTPLQMFFLSYAQVYCAAMSPYAYVLLLELDEHTPHPERVNGVLMNTPAFSKAYKCPVGSRMNPAKKCTIW